jgi:hypothetical protein
MPHKNQEHKSNGDRLILTDELLSISTSPITVAPGATNTVGSTFGTYRNKINRKKIIV